LRQQEDLRIDPSLIEVAEDVYTCLAGAPEFQVPVLLKIREFILDVYKPDWRGIQKLSRENFARTGVDLGLPAGLDASSRWK
jgi:hypothetical protein